MPGFFDVECLSIDGLIAFLKPLVRFSIFEPNRDYFKGANLDVRNFTVISFSAKVVPALYTLIFYII